MAASEVKIIRYGPHQEQYIRMTIPPRENPTSALLPAVVIFHGGFWKAKYGLDNSCIETLRPFFLSKNYVVCEVEYRRREHEGGGFPGTNSDCANALHELHSLSLEENSDLNIDISRVILLGHSAGAYLALWLCCAESEMRDALSFLPILIVAIAPVGDLLEGYDRRLGDEGDVVEQFVGCLPTSVEGKELYRRASPASLLPLRAPTLLVSGRVDVDIPHELVRAFHSQAQERQEHELRLLEVPEADHFALVDTQSSAWKAVYEQIRSMIPED